MPSLTYSAAKTLLSEFVSSQGASDASVGKALNFVVESFITSGQWRGNRFIHSFAISQDSNNNNYFDTVPGIESVLRVIAIDSDGNGEFGDILSDWMQFDRGYFNWLKPTAGGDLQLIRWGNYPAAPLPNGATADTQRYRVLGQVPPDTRTLYCLVRRGYVALSGDNDLVIPSNINALRYGMQAYFYETAGEPQRAGVYWGLAYTALNKATESFEDGEVAPVEVQFKGNDYKIQNLI